MRPASAPSPLSRYRAPSQAGSLDARLPAVARLLATRSILGGIGSPHRWLRSNSPDLPVGRQELGEKFNYGGNNMTPQTFRNWHDQYHGRLLNSIAGIVRNREAAEDITSAALGRALQKLDTFRSESSIDTWIHAIAANKAREYLRQNRTVSLESIDDPERRELREPDCLIQTLEDSESQQKLQKALSQIPVPHRRTLNDFLDGYSVKEIARRHRVPCGTVLSRMFTAKRLLRTAWNSR
jgi:RNA polymerase sigma-70 factor (ECF subfamily)